MFPKSPSLSLSPGGTSQRVTVSTTSAQSATITGHTYVAFISTVTCYVRRGANPVAVSTGGDMYVPANTYVNLTGIDPAGEKIAIIGTGAGTAFISPGV